MVGTGKLSGHLQIRVHGNCGKITWLKLPVHTFQQNIPESEHSGYRLINFLILSSLDIDHFLAKFARLKHIEVLHRKVPLFIQCLPMGQRNPGSSSSASELHFYIAGNVLSKIKNCISIRGMQNFRIKHFLLPHRYASGSDQRFRDLTALFYAGSLLPSFCREIRQLPIVRFFPRVKYFPLLKVALKKPSGGIPKAFIC